MIDSKPNKNYKFNVKRSFVSNYEKERINVNLNDKLLNKKNENEKKNVNKSKLVKNNQPFLKIKFS